MSGTKLNAIALYANFVVLAALGFLTNPLLVHYLGPANFGIWKSCQRILDLSGVADGRATQALKWVIAHNSSDGDDAKRRREVGASLVIWLLWLPVLLLAVAVVVYALPWLISGIPAESVGIARWAALILGANIILTALLNVPDAVLFGTNQAYRSVVLTTFYLVVSNVGMLGAAWLGYGLPTLAIIVLGASILNGVTTWWVARKRVSWWGIGKPQRADVAGFLGFSNWTLVWGLVQVLLLSTDVLLIGFLIGPLMVTKYTFNSYVMQFALSICLMTGSAVTPKLGALIGAGQWVAARDMIRQTRELLLALMTLCGSGIILLNRSFVSTWIGPNYYLGNAVNILIVVTFLQLALIRFEAQIQDVGLQIGTKVLIGLGGAVASLVFGALGYLWLHSLEGLYVGILIGRLPLTLWLPRLVSDLVPGSGYRWQALCGMSVTVLLSAMLADQYRLTGWVQLLPAVVFASGVLSLCAYGLVLSPQTRVLFRTITSRRTPATGAGNEPFIAT